MEIAQSIIINQKTRFKDQLRQLFECVDKFVAIHGMNPLTDKVGDRPTIRRFRYRERLTWFLNVSDFFFKQRHVHRYLESTNQKR